VKQLSVRLLVVACAICAVLATPGTTSATASSTRVAQREAATRIAHIAAIVEFRSETWRWQSLMRKPRTPAVFAERRTSDTEYLRWVRSLWQRRAARAERQANHPPHRAEWLCIHRFERNPAQGWRTHTGNGYFGGLQMDISFQRTYGRELLRRKGTANKWTPVEQMWVAERAYRSGRGFYPWPNTARYCGLI
jgi:Transglycosylase-like domain